MVLHVDAYMAGRHSGFESSETYLVVCCGMCTFGALEPVSGANATTFASAIMKIQMRYGFCHTIVLDKDSNFLVYAAKLWTSSKLIATCYWATTTTRC